MRTGWACPSLILSQPTGGLPWETASSKPNRHDTCCAADAHRSLPDISQYHANEQPPAGMDVAAKSTTSSVTWYDHDTASIILSSASQDQVARVSGGAGLALPLQA